MKVGADRAWGEWAMASVLVVPEMAARQVTQVDSSCEEPSSSAARIAASCCIARPARHLELQHLALCPTAGAEAIAADASATERQPPQCHHAGILPNASSSASSAAKIGLKNGLGISRRDAFGVGTVVRNLARVMPFTIV